MDEIRSTLSTLGSYEPNVFPPPDATSLSFDVTASKQSYCAARDRYLNQRMEEMMLEYVSSYTDENGFMRPEVPSPEDDSSSSAASKAAQVAEVTAASQQVSSLMSSLQSKTAQFKDRLSSLSEAVASFDSAGISIPPPPSSSDYDVTPEELRSQEALLADLVLKKESLRARLSELKSAEAQALKEVADLQSGSYGPAFDAATVLSTASLSSLHPPPSFAHFSAPEHESKLASLRELSDWYSALRSALESLSGVIVQSITPAPSGMTVRVSLHTPPKYTLVVKVGAAAPPPAAASVVDASLECPSGRVEAEEGSAVFAPLPKLGDVVEACRNMDGPEGLRFVVRESSALLHGLQQRLLDVATLKKRYVLKSVDNFDTITVQIPEGQGVSATIAFGKDYSLLSGSLHLTALSTSNILSPFRAALEDLKGATNLFLDSAQESVGVLALVERVCKGVKDVYSTNTAGKGGVFGMPR